MLMKAKCDPQLNLRTGQWTHVCVYHCAQLSYTTQISSDYFPSTIC